MKANQILFSALAVSLISAYTMSPSEFLKHDKALKGRLPASAEEVKKEDNKDNKKPVDNVQCKAESKGEKLEKDIKNQTQDIEAVLKEIDALKNENKELKNKVSARPRSKEDNDGDTIALMSQITSLISLQMQSQMNMQTQLMSTLAQFQFNSAPQYTWDMSQSYSPYGIHENFGMGMGIGIPASGIWGSSSYSNPYSQLPQMTRQPAQQMDYGFSFGQIPQANNMRGFDFNLAPNEPMLPQMQRQQIPGQQMQASPVPASINVISV